MMTCPKCGGKLGVTDNTHDLEVNEVYRRRKCFACGNVIFTVESEIDYESIQDAWREYNRTAKKNRRK